jgi:hypothetical protein
VVVTEGAEAAKVVVTVGVTSKREDEVKIGAEEDASPGTLVGVV